MKLIKIYGKEDLKFMGREKVAMLERKLNKKVKLEVRKSFAELNKDMTSLRIKLNDIEKIMENKKSGKLKILK